jgi:hypothetical protein
MFDLKGVQDNEMIPNQQLTSPEIIKIPFNKPLNLKYGDLLKIKGFIINKNNIKKLMNESFEISFGETYFKIPFSFLILNNIIYFDRNYEDYCFIDFPHDYFFNHNISILQSTYSTFDIKIINTIYYDVEIVIDKYFLDNKEKISLNLEPIFYNIRSIQHFKISYILENQDKNLYVYKTNIDASLLNQGLFIVKDYQHQIQNITITLDNNLTIFNYDVALLNIYSENVNQLIYYGFNINEKYNSTNVVGCLNLSLYDNIEITIKLKSLKDTPDTYLDIYMPNWNILMYKQGLVGLKYSK